MSYAKVITYAQTVEIYEYENNIRNNGRNGRKVQNRANFKDNIKSAADIRESDERRALKRKDNAFRTSLAFRRLIKANLGESSNPLFISFTYAMDIKEVSQGRKHFNSFIRAVRYHFKVKPRYVAVPEFQKSGRLHFHALLWDLPTEELAASERQTRLFAGLWGQGFVDLVATDGNEKIAGYLSKYMIKSFVDPRLCNKKAYVCSSNLRRPQIEKNAILLPYFHGGLDGYPDLSTYTVLQDKEYVTQWLGRGRYRLYQQ